MGKSALDIFIFLFVTTSIILILVSFVIKIVYLYRKKQKAYLNGIEELKSDYEENILKTRLEIQEQTFQAISREIHDNISLSLTLAKLNLNTLNFNDIHGAKDKVKSSIDFVSKAIEDLTDISRSINSEIIINQGLISALKQETDRIKKLNWFTLVYEVTGEPVYMDAQKELFIFRIVQEAFNNILKHAQAKNVKVNLFYKSEHLEITVCDDGKGFRSGSNEKSTHNFSAGLRNMRIRAELVKGHCSIQSKPLAGTTIKVSVPF
jgi:signal transduction histidine kinase